MEAQQAVVSGWWLLLFSLVGSLALTAQRLVQLLFGSRPSRQAEWGIRILATTVVAALAADGIQLVDSIQAGEWSAWLRAGIVAGTLLVVWLSSRLVSHTQLPDASLRWPSTIALLAASVSLAVWSGYRFQDTIQPEFADIGADAFIPGERVPSSRYTGVTDRGREVALLRWKLPSDQLPKVIDSMMALLLGRKPAAILRQDPDPRSNCHGWVFTSGRFLLAGDGVARILEDNRYEKVTTPQVGDIVIYRSGDGSIVHTGLVVGILADSSVMVESKWSVGCRFLHQPQDQPYSPNFEYYRTPRGSHSLAIRFRAKSHVAGQDQPGPLDAG